MMLEKWRAGARDNFAAHQAAKSLLRLAFKGWCSARVQLRLKLRLYRSLAWRLRWRQIREGTAATGGHTYGGSSIAVTADRSGGESGCDGDAIGPALGFCKREAEMHGKQCASGVARTCVDQLDVEFFGLQFFE